MPVRWKPGAFAHCQNRHRSHQVVTAGPPAPFAPTVPSTRRKELK
jgi:hypothetical protein